MPADRSAAAARRVINAIARWRAGQPGMLVVAVDGPGASGKSTMAAAVTEATGAALVHTDHFFQPRPGRRAGPSVDQYYDWRRLRAEALEPLRARQNAVFRRFDWDRGRGLDGVVTVAPGDLVLLEGVFSASPQLADLVDRSVFVATPGPERLRRLRGLVAPEEWDADWLLAEQAYFELTRPPASFDLIVPGASSPDRAPGPRRGSIEAQPHGSSGQPG